jgi:hypothetical protein
MVLTNQAILSTAYNALFVFKKYKIPGTGLLPKKFVDLNQAIQEEASRA